MRKSFAKTSRGYFHKKRHPLLRTEVERALLLTMSIRRPHHSMGGYNGLEHRGRAFWYGHRYGKIRYIKNGQWDGPWRFDDPARGDDA